MKLAVVFPGIGYHSDKPLLYHSKKLAKEFGYDIIDIKYDSLPTNVKGNEAEMNRCIQLAIQQAKDALSKIDFSKYENILFLSKSIGTAVAAACSNAFSISTHNVYYTPIAQSFSHMKQPGIVFHGTADDWVRTEVVKEGCEMFAFPLYIIEGANHSLECGDGIMDLETLLFVMKITKDYILKL